jgi:beta-glucanase (GH16 family)
VRRHHRSLKLKASKIQAVAAASPVPEADDLKAGSEVQTTSGGVVWADEFSGPQGAAPDPGKWNFDVGGNGWGNNELQYYTARSSNASLDGQGDLVITARAERYRGADGVERDYTSARLQTLDKFQFTYGLMEARIQVPAGTGLAPAFWSLGNEAYTADDAWPGCGEIDAMEVLGSEPNMLNGTVHGPWASHPNGIGGEVESPTPLSSGFHTYGVLWGPEHISFLRDGSVYETVSRDDLPPEDAWPFQHPNFLLLNLAVGGDWPGSPDTATRFPARMVVDWVRVWQ